MQRLGLLLQKQSDLLFIAAFVVALSMFVLPMPTPLIDTFIAFNLAFSFIILVTTIYLRSILEISTFPSIILISAVFRLALTVSTARLVLSQADAGEIISAFGEFVIAGNVVVGLVVFAIVALVQFIVVTKGAERIAEVSARFTLDSIPGKQLAIDGDLRNGLTTPAEAQARRQIFERESHFFGAMDGAMRFVKGDAIAALVVILVNLVGGLCIGVFQRGMSFGEAVHLYSLLSIGDGLVAQIPSMLTAVSAGIVVTRIAGPEDASLGLQVFRQVTNNPRGLMIAAAMTAGAGFIPGFPALTLWLFSTALALLAWRSIASKSRLQAAVPRSQAVEESRHQPLDRTKYGDPFVATVDPVTFERLESEGLAGLLEDRIRDVARVVGLAVTVPTFQSDSRMIPNAIHLQVENVPAAMVECPPDRAIGDVATDLARITRRYIASLFGLADATQWLSSLETRLGSLAVAVRDQIPLIVFTAITRHLLASGTTLSQPRAFLETILQAFVDDQNPQSLAEKGRHALSKQIAYGLIDGRGILPVISFDAFWETILRPPATRPRPAESAEHERLLRVLAEQVHGALREANAQERDPIVLVPDDIRSATQSLLHTLGCYIPVVAIGEVPREMTVEVLSTIPAPLRQAA